MTILTYIYYKHTIIMTGEDIPTAKNNDLFLFTKIKKKKW